MIDAKRNWRKLAAAAVLSTSMLFSAQSAHAIFGIGDIVFDPTNTAKAIEQIYRMKEQYEVLKKNLDAVSGATNMTGDCN